ncbi:hypothetical protein ACFQBQ_00645 [Granulicella cerasi]|uniref:Uncharacterized protein n=1 Tax=Granulicella cerasi TaxID=741063 RepID=A0ABW1Z6N6_9BACT|nr:hypothetical protein [Granulicella cerasi]
MLLLCVAHRRANIHRFKEQLRGAPEAPTYVGPGGQAPVTLSRTSTSMGSRPEFTALTFLPGRGMQISQIRAILPGAGDVALLGDTPYDGTSSVADETLNDKESNFAGEFIVPWIGTLSGHAVRDADGSAWIEANVNGATVRVPASTANPNESDEGLLQRTASTHTETALLDDGQTAASTFVIGKDADKEHSQSRAWPSQLQLDGSMRLEGQSIEITWRVHNNGNTPVPFNFAWRPRFAIPGAQRGKVTLAIPSTTQLAESKRPVDATHAALDFSKEGGSAITQSNIDAQFVQLRGQLMGDGTAVELRLAENNSGIRLVMLDNAFQAVHIATGPHMEWVEIAPEMTAKGLPSKVLDAGQTYTLRVRLEIFSTAPHSSL